MPQPNGNGLASSSAGSRLPSSASNLGSLPPPPSHSSNGPRGSHRSSSGSSGAVGGEMISRDGPPPPLERGIAPPHPSQQVGAQGAVAPLTTVEKLALANENAWISIGELIPPKVETSDSATSLQSEMGGRNVGEV